MSKNRAPLIVGNWKATPKTLDEGIKFIKSLEKKVASPKYKLPKKTYHIAAPSVFISSLTPHTKRGEIGAQTFDGVVLGQHTGQVTPEQIKSTGATFTIIGHSEVRKRGETQAERKEKVLAALKNKLTTIVCFGEATRDKEGKYLGELEGDIKETLHDVPRELFNNLVIAYEPLWAIGSKEPATPSECFEVVIAIRRALASLSGIDYAKKVNILYGGSVTKESSKAFLEEGGVDGLLIGRASQEVTSFFEIITSCHN